MNRREFVKKSVGAGALAMVPISKGVVKREDIMDRIKKTNSGLPLYIKISFRDQNGRIRWAGSPLKNCYATRSHIVRRMVEEAEKKVRECNPHYIIKGEDIEFYWMNDHGFYSEFYLI